MASLWLLAIGYWLLAFGFGFGFGFGFWLLVRLLADWPLAFGFSYWQEHSSTVITKTKPRLNVLINRLPEDGSWIDLFCRNTQPSVMISG